MQASDSFYVVLGLDGSASALDIRTAYQKAIKVHHPDKTLGLQTTQAAALNEAYAVLSDPAQRKMYDQQLAEARRRNSSRSRGICSAVAVTSKHH